MEKHFAHLLRLLLTSPLGAIVLGLSKQLYPHEIEGWVQVSQVCLDLPRLDREFHGYRIAQISDFHIGTWLKRKGLDEAVDMVNEQRPDLVAITGDFVTYEPERFVDDLAAALGRLSAPNGVVAILGNHDHWTDPGLIRSLLNRVGIVDLSNRAITLNRGPAFLHIAGVDDLYGHHARLDKVLARLPDQGAAVLLAHEPDFAEVSAASGRFDLQISGHSHGGQVVFPRIGAPILPSYCRKYPSGLYRVGDMFQYTNRGLGTAEIPVRWNCPAEITVFTLESPINAIVSDRPQK